MMFSNKKGSNSPSKNYYSRIPTLQSSSSSSNKLVLLRRKKTLSFYIVFFIFLVFIMYVFLSRLLPAERNSNEEGSFVYPHAPPTVGQRIGFITPLTPRPPLIITNETFSFVPLPTTMLPAELHHQLPTIITITATNTSSNNSDNVVSGFSEDPVVENDDDDEMTCIIPKLDPFDNKIKNFIKFNKTINCADKLFPLLFDSQEDSTIVPLTQGIIDAGYGSCCYRTIHRKKMSSDKGFKLSNSSDCYPISIEDPTINDDMQQHEFLAIFCKRFSSNQTEMELSINSTKNATSDKGKVDGAQEQIVDTHVLVHLKPTVEKRVAEYYSKLENANEKGQTNTVLLEHERVNVIILGIDAVSHMNFLRVMPNVHSYMINNLSAVEMQSFNKVGDNTLPNVAATLAALNFSELKSCIKGKALDGCPWIWKEYASQGYRTSFGEDAPGMGMFNRDLKGFEKPNPTDYYLRPFAEASESLIGTRKHLFLKICLGPRLAFEGLLSYMKKMAFRMGHDKRYFQLIWTTPLTHDFLNYGHLGEKALLSALQWFHDNGYLNQSVLVLMSDHGLRWGKFRETVQGQLEDRLPLLYFIFPEWFKKKYFRAYANLLKNVNRLTTHYDLHETLADLLDLNSISPGKLATRELELAKAKAEKKLPRGISQFIPIPKSRTCEMAEVSEHYCTCHPRTTINVKAPMVKQVANFIVFSINQLVSQVAECSILELKRIKQAFSIGTQNSSTLEAYQIMLETSPGGAIFESVVEKGHKGFWKVSGISRLNMYGRQSHCAKDWGLKVYCYCLDLLEPHTKDKGNNK